jgi:hypothetical protein
MPRIYNVYNVEVTYNVLALFTLINKNFSIPKIRDYGTTIPGLRIEKKAGIPGCGIPGLQSLVPDSQLKLTRGNLFTALIRCKH